MGDHMVEKKISADDLSAALGKTSDGMFEKSAFLGYFENCENCDIEMDKLEQLFDSPDKEDNGSIPKDAFLKLLRTYYSVVKETVMTVEFAIKESKAVRRLDVDEIIEVHECPIRDNTVGIARIKGRAVKDGAAGWTTVLGSNGSVFLKELGCAYQVVKNTGITANFELDDGEPVQMLKEGDMLDVLEWDRKNEASNLVRLKVQVQGSGTIGWVTKIGQDGAPL